MAKQSGLGDHLYVAGYDLSGDIAALNSISGSTATLDKTGIDKSAHVRIGGQRTGNIDAVTHFNDATVAGGDTDQEHLVFSALPTTDVHLMYCRGTTQGKRAACLIAKQLNYDGTRGTDGDLTLAVSSQANGYGLEWGWLLTAAARTDTGATNGTGIGGLWAQTDFGLQAYLQVVSFTGTDATITIEESSDNGAADAWAAVTGGAFTQVTAARTTERIATANDQTIEQYLRVATSTTGGFTEMTFVVMVNRNLTATTF